MESDSKWFNEQFGKLQLQQESIFNMLEKIQATQEKMNMDLATIKAELDTLKTAVDNTVTNLATMQTNLNTAIANEDLTAMQAISDEITGMITELTPAPTA